MGLNETIELMESNDFKDRFVAEYAQLVIRKNGLEKMLAKYKDGTLPFKPKCSPNLLEAQLVHMGLYAKVLEQRAEIEGIELPAKSFEAKEAFCKRAYSDNLVHAMNGNVRISGRLHGNETALNDLL